MNVVTAELVGLIGEALRTAAWEGFGIRSPEHWVVWRCGVSPARARRLVVMARTLDGLPEFGGLFESGSLSEDQTAVIVRHTDADHDRQVAELAPSLTVPQLARVLPSLPRPNPTRRPTMSRATMPAAGRTGGVCGSAMAMTACGGVRSGCPPTRGRWCRRGWRWAATTSSGCGTPTTATVMRVIPGTCPGPTHCCAWRMLVSMRSTPPAAPGSATGGTHPGDPASRRRPPGTAPPASRSGAAGGRRRLPVLRQHRPLPVVAARPAPGDGPPPTHSHSSAADCHRASRRGLPGPGL